MKSKFTIRDIAVAAHVSTSTVHKAIYGKPGVGEALRQKILEIAKEHNYSINSAASHLKRGILNIVVAFPQPPRRINQFFRGLWRGIDESEALFADRNVTITRLSCGQNIEEQCKVMDRILAMEDIHGLITYCWGDAVLAPYFAALKERGVPVVTVESDAVSTCRIGCVTIDAERSGRLVAEAMEKMQLQNGRLLLLSSLQPPTLLRDKAYGFSTYVQEKMPTCSVMQFCASTYDDLEESIYQELVRNPDIVGVYCTSGSAGIPMCRALQRAGLNGRVVSIASDVYEELIPYLDDGTVSATIWQAPEQQSEHALRILYDYISERKVPSPRSYVPLGIVLKNNFNDYM